MTVNTALGKQRHENKSKLKFRSLVKLAFWGYKKNKAKSIASIFTFVILSILSIVFAALSFGNLNYAYAQSINKCEKKNVFAEVSNISNRNPNPQRFMDKLSYGCAEVFGGIPIYLDEKEREEETKFCKQYQIIENEGVLIPGTNIITPGDRQYLPDCNYGIIYEDKVGVDVDVLYGDYPKEFNEVMLPYCYALYMSQVLTDYKTDNIHKHILVIQYAEYLKKVLILLILTSRKVLRKLDIIMRQIRWRNALFIRRK